MPFGSNEELVVNNGGRRDGPLVQIIFLHDFKRRIEEDKGVSVRVYSFLP